MIIVGARLNRLSIHLVTGAESELEYIVSKVEPGRPAQALGLQPGSRVARLKGRDVRGESQEFVRQALRAAPLPLEVHFEVPLKRWLICGHCGHARPSGVGRCADCDDDLEEAAADRDEILITNPEAEVDSWEDL